MLKTGSTVRGVLGVELGKMLECAMGSLHRVSRETTSPAGSNTFQVLSNLFIALDILSVNLTMQDGTQFSSVQPNDLITAGCSTGVVAAFVALQQTTFTVNLPTISSTTTVYPWVIWAAYKHGAVGDVVLCRNAAGALILMFGDVEVLLADLQSYIAAAQHLVAQALP